MSEVKYATLPLRWNPGLVADVVRDRLTRGIEATRRFEAVTDTVRVLRRWRRATAAAIHLPLVAIASWLAFLLRFDGAIQPREWTIFVDTLPATLLVHAGAFAAFGLHRGFWRYTGLSDLARIVGAAGASALLLHLIFHRWLGLSAYPRSVLLLTALLATCLVCGVRLVVRIVRELTPHVHGKRLLIVGAGDAGEMIARDLRRHGLQPVGFIDDDPGKAGLQIHGVPVFGGRSEFARVIAATRPHEVLIAIPSASPSTLRAFVTALRPHKLPITTLPRCQELADGTVAVHQMRKLEIKDLLTRSPVGLDPAPLVELIRGRRVMVTGAGGSIGSELSRQIAALQPALLLLCERYENSLYAVSTDLTDRGLGAVAVPVIGDVTDRLRLDALMAEYRPELVFHAAAHKHVPLMELNPCEAVKNNVLGTRTVAESAARHGVGRFVLISTDKAVNPSSTMGATKRVAELLLQRLAGSHSTVFATVRFGNVLGSNGSVLPRWIGQIQAGGPVTVTHAEIRRYFMLIPEAVQLVLHATTAARGGEVFVLEMGQQVRLVDMARHVIRLSGFVPDEEIPIVFTGLRPGEKLFEELVASGERMEASGIEQILRVCPGPPPDGVRLIVQVDRLAELAIRGDTAGVMTTLREIVPTFSGGDVKVLALSRGTPRMAVASERLTRRRTARRAAGRPNLQESPR